ncbi:MAG: hypothetical protein WB760_31850 [Xanthobacteraceae bacterium]
METPSSGPSGPGRWYDWGARIDFARNLVMLAFSIVTGVVTYFDGWDPPMVLLAVILAAAAGALIYIGFCKYLDRQHSGIAPTVRNPTQIAPAASLDSRPLEIIFDKTNPGKKFWSIEQMTDENGKRVPGSFWEYRALIKNTSSKTVRNVKATVEAIGALPSRPEPSQFDINKKNLIDLALDDEALVLIRRWFNPPIVAGMVASENAYGPIKMTASADDVQPTTKLFGFEPTRTPMIFELDASTGQEIAPRPETPDLQSELKAFHDGLYVPEITVQWPEEDRETNPTLYITVKGRAAEGITLHSIEGNISVARTPPAGRETPLGMLPSSPHLHEPRQMHFDARREFYFTIAQELPPALHTELLNWKDNVWYVFDFENLHIFVQSDNDSKKVVSLPLWDAAVLQKHGAGILAMRRWNSPFPPDLPITQ